MFITPETVPAEAPPRSAVTDQKELAERYSAPAPPASTIVARRASAACVPSAMKTRGQRDTAARDPAAADALAVAFRQPVADPAAQRRAGRHRDERQHAVVASSISGPGRAPCSDR